MFIEHLNDVDFRPDGGEPIRMSRVGYLPDGWACSRIDRDWQPFVTGDAVPYRRLRPFVGKEGELRVIRKGRELARLRVRLHETKSKEQRGNSYPNALFLRLRTTEATRP